MSRIQVRQHKSFRHGRRAQNRGFTLLEMLVAVAIFAVIGVMSTTLLTQMVQFSNATTDRGERLTELQRAMTILQRDIEQLSYRYIRDELGDPVNELQIGGVALIELTRRGWQNPMALRRSQLQRVAYVVEEQTLFRVFWPVLDRAPDTEPISQVLLRGGGRNEVIARDAGRPQTPGS
ncbi:MAG: type II secretion system minor pseudopilin GspJ, partial [Gammaproteobacteria bacterium]|nr:type II secretion system minor pseudopilin GspJ [Gammaproteobacteria bacterium]